MKKLLILLLTLAAIALVGYYCAYIKSAPAIEKDINTRSQAALNDAGLDWVNVDVDGRNLLLKGVAPSQEAKAHAEEIVRIDGYNLIDNQLTVVDDVTTQANVSSVDDLDPVDHSTTDVTDKQDQEESEGELATDTLEKTKELTPEVAEVEQLEEEVVVEPDIDYVLKIYKNEKNQVTLNGVLDKKLHQAIVETAHKQYGENNVLDYIQEMAVIKPDSVLHSSQLILQKMHNLKLGIAELSKDNISLKGEMLTGKRIQPFQEVLTDNLRTDVVAYFDLVESKIEIPPETIQANQEQEQKQKEQEQKAKEQKIALGKECQSDFDTLLKESIRFKISSAIIQKSSFKVLNKIVLVAEKCNDFYLNIHGHTDSKGSAELNNKLSLNRAESVLNYLSSKNININRLRALGHGSTKPIASNNTVVGRAKNRRIEITVEDKQ